MALKPTEESMRKSMANDLKPGEELVTIGWASGSGGTKYYFIGLTPERLIIQNLSMTYKLKGSEELSLADIASADLEEGYKVAKPLTKMISKKAEHSLEIRTKAGEKKVFRFPNILGLDNINVADAIVEYLRQALA